MSQSAGHPKARHGSPQDVKPEVATVSSLNGAERDQEFNFRDGNIYLKIENRVFFVHRFKLVHFRQIEQMVWDHDEIVLDGTVSDFQNVLRIMYTSFDSLVRFDPDTPALTSALRVATTYDYPELRAFAIRHLEAKKLPILDYLPLARDFGIVDWQERALDYLVSRDQPITEAEANILGTKLHVATTVRREERLIRRPKPLESRVIAPAVLQGNPTKPPSPSISGGSHQPEIPNHSSSDRDVPDLVHNRISVFTEPTQKPSGVSSGARQTNATGRDTPRTPSASGSGGSGARRSNSHTASSDPKSIIPKTDCRQQTKSWDYIEATRRIQNRGNTIDLTRDSDEEDEEERVQFSDTTTPEIAVPGKMRCKPDPRTIGRWIFPLNKGKREYQLDIIKRSLFDNTLVYLPAGFGKTFIAGSVMFNFYRWFPTGKVVFIAPTKPLITQQIDACHSGCGIPRRDAIELTGTDRKGQRRRAWRERRVFYITPQTFLNDLRDGTCDALNVVLVVMGGADRATGTYAYASIVHFLMAHNLHHRILALATTIGKDLELVQELVDDLHISRIEIRDEQDAELQQYSFEKHIDLKTVRTNNVINSIKTSLAAVMWPLLKTVQTAGCCNNAEPETMSSYCPTFEITNIMVRKSNNGMRVLAPLKYLVTLSRAMEYLLVGSVTMCKRCLDDFYASGTAQFQSEWKENADWIATMSYIESHHREAVFLGLKTPYPPHPKMQRLNALVRELLDGNGERGNRIMVYTSFRECVDEIVLHLNANGPKVRASRFIGQVGGKGGEQGMSQKERSIIIGRFKTGELNVLVATSIGEEGSDIEETDLLICYDAQKAPVRMVKLQRARRTVQKRDGKVVVLLAEGREKIWDKAKEPKQDVQKASTDLSIVGLFDDAAKMIPDGVHPQCVEEILGIGPYVPEVHSNLSGKRPRITLEISEGTTKRRHVEGNNLKIPEGASVGAVTASSLATRMRPKKV
ncbi:3'-5' DNA helicase [Ceratobasidium sp. 392]|nr:3'-5' DNA helicase [Ceratobasidium sp. 392]